ncbi:MAG: CDP-glycerol glycerophosphotransferase family protein [Clostridia bacterium]|nr:CDP-glycerol glycerophosphotransferase family protein [Clostridia bacterium]
MGELIRLLIAFASRNALKLCLPFLKIKTDRVLFQSYREKKYACNPRYICEKLMEIAPQGLEIAWSFREPEKFEYLKEKGIRVLKAGSWEAIQYALTAKVVCVNTYYKPTLPRRRGQEHIRTWHGGGAYKKVAGMEKMGFIKRLSVNYQLSGATLYLSSSRAFTQQTVRDSFGFKGEVLEIGMPRNDMLVNGISDDALNAIRASIGLRAGVRLALYAPTYREDLKISEYGLDVDRLTAALRARFGGEWLIAYRGHVFVKSGHTQLMDLSGYEDMQPLLAASDVLITDYSSSMWDMSLTGKPVFLYCPDLYRYDRERGFYTPVESWPYPLAENNDELEQNVLAFDEESYAEQVKAHHAALGSCESGRASELTARRILSETIGQKTKD